VCNFVASIGCVMSACEFCACAIAKKQKESAEQDNKVN
jgi:hypothetical protein